MQQHDIDTLRFASNACSNISAILSEEPNTLTQKDIAEVRELMLLLRRNLRDVQASFNK